VLQRRRQDPVDLAHRGVRIVEHRRGDGQLLEDPQLAVEFPGLMMQERV
jgi:hypothetical protein